MSCNKKQLELRCRIILVKIINNDDWFNFFFKEKKLILKNSNKGNGYTPLNSSNVPTYLYVCVQ